MPGPILNYVAGLSPYYPEEWFVEYQGLFDLNRSGRVELLTSRTPADLYPVLIAAHYRGVAYGFGDRTVELDGADDPANLLEQVVIPVDDYPRPGSDCCDKMSTPILADFDGNGFADILTLKYDPDGFPGAPCYGISWCATLRYTSRETTQGRVTSSDSSWGGRTKLEWTFSGTGYSTGNDDLSVNVEVLAAVDGSEGRPLCYHGDIR